MNKQQLAAKIWASANNMRSKIEANEYKDYILGFIFYKFLSEKEEHLLKSWEAGPEDIKALDEEEPSMVGSVQQTLGYFIAPKDLFSSWLAMGRDFDIDNVRTALAAFDRRITADESGKRKRLFGGIFDTLQTGLSKLGTNAASQTKAASDLIRLIDDIPMEDARDYDALGFIYEYLISQFASNAGKKAGEFYTPHEVSNLMAQIVANHLKGRSQIEIYDPTSGSGSLLITIGQAAEKVGVPPEGIKYYAQEFKQATYNLTRMNLVMRGINPDNIATRNDDTLGRDWPWFEENDPEGTYEPLFVDAVVSNPPYSQQWDPSGRETDPRFAGYGIAPKSKADYAFLLHELFHLKSDGVMTIVLPHGVLFRGDQEGVIRRSLVEHHNIEAIIGLPANIFYGTGIPTIVMVLRKPRSQDDAVEDGSILIVDASKGFEKYGKSNRLRASDIKRIVDVVEARCDVEKFARLVSIDEVRANDYNLNIPRYVDSSAAPETWDVYATMFGGVPTSELDALACYWEVFPSLRAELFEEGAGPTARLRVDDVRATIAGNTEVTAYCARFAETFADFGAYLYEELVDEATLVPLAMEEDRIGAYLFDRLADIPLIDCYEAYQALDDQWQKISIDLEVITDEGFDAVRKVDPNMVVKKKDGKDVEVQDGWAGHVIPFALVQETLLSDETAELASWETRLAEIAGECEELLDDLSEEERESDATNEVGDAFNAKGVTQLLKQEADRSEGSFGAKLVQAKALLDEEKKLKAELKRGRAALDEKTRNVIEGLSDEQARELLNRKWVEPLVDRIASLPGEVVDNLAKKVADLTGKYAETLPDLDRSVAETERELSGMLGELVGSDADMAGIRELRALLSGGRHE